MNIKLRRLYFILIIIVFLVVAPALLTYAIGYRFDFEQNKIVQVGIISIETKPRDCQIYIDGVLHDKTTPTIINNLLPKRYTIEIKKEGYFTYTKTVDVNSGLSTVFPDIRLFKNDIKINMLDSDIIRSELSPDKKLLAYSTKNSFIILSINTGKLIMEDSKKYEISDIFWSPDSSKIILTSSNNKNYLINIRNSKISDLSEFFKQQISNINWDKDSNNLFYGTSSNSFKNFDLNSKNDNTVLNFPIERNYYVNNDYIIYYNGKALIKTDLKTKNNKVILNQVNDPKYKFLDSKNSFVPIIDLNNKTLYLFDETEDSYIEIDEQVQNASWSPSEFQLLLNNENTLWVFDLKENEKFLLMRSSQTINNAGWYPTSDYIVANNNGKIKIIEFDDYNLNNFELIDAETNELYISENGKYIYYIDNENTLNSLLLE